MTVSLHQHVHKLAILAILIEEGSFRAACQKTHLTQSALSQILKQLEELFGMPLLIRKPGHLEATPSGLDLIRQMKPILQALDGVAETIFESSSVPVVKSLQFGTYESIAIDVIPRFATRLLEAFPKLDLHIKTARTYDLMQLVKKGELSTALIISSEGDELLHKTPIAEDEMGLYVKANCIQEDEWTPFIRQFGYGTMAQGKDGYPDYFRRFMKPLEDIAKPVLVSDSFEALRAAAASGTMAAVLPSRVARRISGPALDKIVIPNQDLGLHKIVLVSRESSDRKVHDFIARELQILLGQL